MLNRVIREIDLWIILGSELIDGADGSMYIYGAFNATFM